MIDDSKIQDYCNAKMMNDDIKKALIHAIEQGDERFLSSVYEWFHFGSDSDLAWTVESVIEDYAFNAFRDEAVEYFEYEKFLDELEGGE